MADTKRSTIYFEPKVYRALKIKAAVTDESISNLVNDAVREALREDEIDLAAYRQRRHESSRPLEDVVRDLKRKGRL
ncbi:MAG TPA: hypothetical protein VLB32_08710 [Candidatus Acidoferrales bacterium]|nr:hypothetical protein [Candidatus Acidoferrales bacterium]